MVSRVGVSEDFRKQVLGYGLTTAEILYRMPDHRSLLQTYVWQSYDLFPKFPALQDFLDFWQQKLEGPLFSGKQVHHFISDHRNPGKVMFATANDDWFGPDGRQYGAAPAARRPQGRRL